MRKAAFSITRQREAGDGFVSQLETRPCARVIPFSSILLSGFSPPDALGKKPNHNYLVLGYCLRRVAQLVNPKAKNA